MDTYQDITSINRALEQLFKRSRNLSVSSTYKRFRKLPRISLLGDYIVLAHIVNTLHELGRKPYTRPHIARAVKLLNDPVIDTKADTTALINHLFALSRGKVPKK